MKYRTFLVLLLFCAGNGFAGQSKTDQPINLNQSLVVTESQRAALEMEAARGSGEAASKLFLFYGFVALNPAEERRWTLIGAENGDAASQYNMYQDLSDSDSRFDRERALFWLRKAAASGDADARKELKKVERSNRVD